MSTGLLSKWIKVGAIFVSAFVAQIVPVSAAPSDVNFYKGKVVRVLVGVNAGTPVDRLMRLVASHIGAHLPGEPTVVPENMAGAGGLAMANYLYNIAPQDGTVIGLLQNGLALSQAFGEPAARFDARQFNWLGSVTPRNHGIMIAMKSAHVQNIGDALRLPLLAGASAKGSHEYTVAAILNEFLGTRIKIIPGYPSIAAIYMAMETGELEGVGTSWEEFKIQRRDFIRDHKINVLVQNGPRAAELKDVPSLQELLKSGDDREIVDLLLSSEALGRPFAAPPHIDADRLRILQTAFDETLTDPAFRQEAATQGVDVDPISNDSLRDVVNRVLDTPGRLIPRAKKIME